MTATPTNSTHKRILGACYSFLVPVARFLLRAGIGYREFEEICRLAFVDVATREYGLRGRPTNVSRVSAMTGIPRKDVVKIRRNANVHDIDGRGKLSPLGDVLQRWYTSPNFLGRCGTPLPLPYSGSGVSFEALVRECASDLPAGAIRAELIRYGAIADTEGVLHPLRREVVPEGVDEKLITSLSFNMRCLTDTIAYNTDPHRVGPPRIERFVQSGDLGSDARVRLRDVIQRRLVTFTEHLDDIFSRETTADQAGRRGRSGVGVYYYED